MAALSIARRNLLGAAVAAVASSGARNAAEAETPRDNRCAAAPRRSVTPAISWDDDVSYNVRVDRIVDPAGLERKRIVYTGDYLIINQEYTPSLVRTPEGPAENVKRITFDARRLDLAASLSLKDSKISFLCRDLYLISEGFISLFGEFSSGLSELRLVVDSLYLMDDLFIKPFNIYPDSKGDFPKVVVRARAVWRGNRQLAGEEAKSAIWLTFGASDELDAPPMTSVDIKVGTEADEDLVRSLREEVIWPAEVYSKALRRHAAYPFDCGVQSDITKWAETLASTLGQTSLTEAAAGFPVLAARVMANLDAFGHGPSWAPRKSLVKQIVELDAAIEEFSPSKGSALSDELIDMISDGFTNQLTDPGKLERLAARRDEIRTSIDDLDNKIDAAVDETRHLKISFDSLKISINAARERIKRASLDEQKRLNNAAAAKQGLATVGTLAGLATSFYAGPQAGAAVATGFQVVGNIAYAHNTTGLNPKTLNEIVEDGAKFYASMQAVLEQWDKFRDQKEIYKKVNRGEKVLRGPEPEEGQLDKRQPYTPTQAAQDMGSSLLGFGTAVVGVTAGLQVPTPQPLSLTDKENLDPLLQQYLELFSANQKRQSELLSAIQELSSKKTSSVAEVTQVESSIRDLLSIIPQNDLQFRQWTERARYLWINEIRGLVQRIYLIERSYFFETGEELPLRADLLQFPATLTALTDAGRVKVLAPGNLVTKTDVKDHLLRQRARVKASSRAVYAAVQDGVDRYLSRSQRKLKFQRAAEFRVDDKDPNRRSFVRGLNAQLVLSVARARAGYTGSSGSSGGPPVKPTSPAAGAMRERERRPGLISLYIPFVFPSPAFVNEAPIRFVRARIASVVWQNRLTNVGDDGVEFTVVHPGYGEIAVGPSRRFFDLRENDAINEVRCRTTAYMLKNNHFDDGGSEPANLLGDDYYTYYPALSDYFLVAELTSANWARAPQVAKIVILWELVQ